MLRLHPPPLAGRHRPHEFGREQLVECPGQVVRRQTLCEKLWPDTYVAFEHSLNTAVNKLRSVLGDGAQSPRYIETRPRMGYRFVAPVERVNGAAPVVAISRPAGGQTRPAGCR